MSFRESFMVDCDCCGDPVCNWMPGRARIERAHFPSHTAAVRTLKQRNWYVDAHVVLCPHCDHHAVRWQHMEDGGSSLKSAMAKSPDYQIASTLSRIATSTSSSPTAYVSLSNWL